MADDKLDSLRVEAEQTLSDLIEKKIGRRQTDEWVLNLESRYGSAMMSQLEIVDAPLSELIDAIGLVFTPDDQEGYLYSIEDFRHWLEEYHASSRKRNL